MRADYMSHLKRRAFTTSITASISATTAKTPGPTLRTKPSWASPP
ncbi:hypothetical protein [Streptomyces albipurpureus]|nr:hypothetical protein [Streptomyces sp. CWNU-1]